MTTRRVCATCSTPVRSVRGQWRHDERHNGVAAAREADEDHRTVATWGTPPPRPTVDPKPAEQRKTRQPRRPIAPIPQPVQWGPPMRFERWPFDADLVRERGCLTAAALDTIGDL